MQTVSREVKISTTAKEERPWSSIPSISRLTDFSLAAYHMYLFGGMVLELYPSSHTTLNLDSPRCPWQMAKKALRRPSDTMIYETIGGFVAVIQGSSHCALAVYGIGNVVPAVYTDKIGE